MRVAGVGCPLFFRRGACLTGEVVMTTVRRSASRALPACAMQRAREPGWERALDL